MPNFQSLTISDTSYDGTLFVRTVVPDSDGAPENLLFQTTRGKSVWLPPADCRDLIAWMHNALGDGLYIPLRDALPATLPAPVDMPEQRFYKPCAETDPKYPERRCVLIEDHGSAFEHVGMFGDRW